MLLAEPHDVSLDGQAGAEKPSSSRAGASEAAGSSTKSSYRILAYGDPVISESFHGDVPPEPVHRSSEGAPVSEVLTSQMRVDRGAGVAHDVEQPEIDRRQTRDKVAHTAGDFDESTICETLRHVGECCIESFRR